jgi:hypothetical protein
MRADRRGRDGAGRVREVGLRRAARLAAGVAADSAELTRALGSGPSEIPTVKARYTRFFARAGRRTDDLARAIERAGAPKADNGLGYARDLATALDRTRKGISDARARFAALPTTGLRSYAAGAARVRDSLDTLFTGVGASLDRIGSTYTDPALDRAFRDEPDCRRLT